MTLHLYEMHDDEIHDDEIHDDDGHGDDGHNGTMDDTTVVLDCTEWFADLVAHGAWGSGGAQFGKQV